MEFYSKILSSDWLLVGNVAFVIALLRAVWTAPWRAFVNNIEQVNVLIGLFLLLTALWLLPVGVRDGLKLHLLGASLCVLIFDWQITLVMLSTIMLVELWKYEHNLSVLGIYGMVMIVLPIMATRVFFSLFQRFGIKSYFSFIWWNGYVCGFLIMMLVGLINGLLVWSLGQYSWFTFKQDYLAFLPVLSSSESVLTGAFISGLAVFMPNAVAYFDQDIYFAKKPLV